MGWNDHVSLTETRCLKCGAVEEWEWWDEIALARYSGELGRKLGHDAVQANRCPHCGSTEGEIVADDY
jgi:hypothetical protein